MLNSVQIKLKFKQEQIQLKR